MSDVGCTLVDSRTTEDEYPVSVVELTIKLDWMLTLLEDRVVVISGNVSKELVGWTLRLDVVLAAVLNTEDSSVITVL